MVNFIGVDVASGVVDEGGVVKDVVKIVVFIGNVCVVVKVLV